MATATSQRVRTVAQPPIARARRWTMPTVIAVLALFLRLWAPGPVSQTQDEFSWLQNSDAFRSGVMHGDFQRATGGQTMPGVTTLWSGTLGYASVSVAHEVGLVSKAPVAFSPTVLRVSRAFVALWCSIALGLFVAIAALLVGRRAAAIAGVLLATEPFLVGHSDVLHTDAMVTMFGALSAIALLAGLRAVRLTAPAEHGTDPASTTPIASRGAQIPLVVLSGAAGGLAVLTKLNAVPLVLGAAAVVMTVEVLAARRNAAGAIFGWWRFALRDNARLVAIWAVSALAIVVVLWPALWVAPREQLRLIRYSLDQLDRGQGLTFFRERLTPDAGVTYYPVALVLRMTPWFLIGAVFATLGVVSRFIWGCFRRAQRASPRNNVAATLLLASAPYALVITFTSQKYDRYSLPLFPFLAIACGVLLAEAVDHLGKRVRSTQWVLPAGALVAMLLTLSTLSHAPFAISYVDPLAGGQSRAHRTILLGWGEGLEVLGAEIRRREGEHCDDARVLAPFLYIVAFPCGRLVNSAPTRGVRGLDYYVRYVKDEQRALSNDKALYNSVRRAGRLVKAVRIGGLNYAELWKIGRHTRP